MIKPMIFNSISADFLAQPEQAKVILSFDPRYENLLDFVTTDLDLFKQTSLLFLAFKKTDINEISTVALSWFNEAVDNKVGELKQEFTSRHFPSEAFDSVITKNKITDETKVDKKRMGRLIKALCKSVDFDAFLSAHTPLDGEPATINPENLSDVKPIKGIDKSFSGDLALMLANIYHTQIQAGATVEELSKKIGLKLPKKAVAPLSEVAPTDLPAIVEKASEALTYVRWDKGSVISTNASKTLAGIQAGTITTKEQLFDALGKNVATPEAIQEAITVYERMKEINEHKRNFMDKTKGIDLDRKPMSHLYDLLVPEFAVVSRYPNNRREELRMNKAHLKGFCNVDNQAQVAIAQLDPKENKDLFVRVEKEAAERWLKEVGAEKGANGRYTKDQLSHAKKVTPYNTLPYIKVDGHSRLFAWLNGQLEYPKCGSLVANVHYGKTNDEIEQLVLVYCSNLPSLTPKELSDMKMQKLNFEYHSDFCLSPWNNAFSNNGIKIRKNDGALENALAEYSEFFEILDNLNLKAIYSGKEYAEEIIINITNGEGKIIKSYPKTVSKYSRYVSAPVRAAIIATAEKVNSKVKKIGTLDDFRLFWSDFFRVIHDEQPKSPLVLELVQTVDERIQAGQDFRDDFAKELIEFSKTNFQTFVSLDRTAAPEAQEAPEVVEDEPKAEPGSELTKELQERFRALWSEHESKYVKSTCAYPDSQRDAMAVLQANAQTLLSEIENDANPQTVEILENITSHMGDCVSKAITWPLENNQRLITQYNEINHYFNAGEATLNASYKDELTPEKLEALVKSVDSLRDGIGSQMTPELDLHLKKVVFVLKSNVQK